MYFAAGQIEALALDESKSVGEIQTEAQRIIERSGRTGASDFFAPVVEANETSVRVDWINLQVRAVVTGLKEHKDGDIDGFLKISTTIPGHPRDLHSARFNFVASRSQTEWANILSKRADITDWHEVMATLCRIVTDHVHRVVPLEVIGEADDVKPVEFALWPLIMYKGPTVLFGEPGTLKSYVATLCANLVATGQDLLDMRVERQLREPLYLDWEAERDRTDERVMMLRNGLGLPKSPFWYLHCDRTLADDVERIKDRIDEAGTEFVIIDSLALAAGGELTTAQPAIDFFRALRRLNCSSLIIAHTSKEQSAQKTIYGSVYFNALARSVWEMRKYQEEGSNTVSVGFIHKKGNYGQLEHSFGLGFIFETDRRCVLVSRDDVHKNPSAEAARPLPYRIIRLLEERGKMRSPDIAEELGASSDATRVALNRLADKKQVLRIGNGVWAAQVAMDTDLQAPF